MTNYDLLNARIAARLKELNLSPRAASLKAGLGETYLRGLRRKDRPSKPGAENLIKIAKAIDLEPSYLLNALNDRHHEIVIEKPKDLQPMDEQDRHSLGMTTRRSVLGDAHVDRSIRNATPFTEEFQDLITRYAWGTIWTRDGLDHPTRRLLVIAMMIALNREAEFKLHIRAALTHAISLDTIKEVILQSAIYCGVPAANTAFHWASEVVEELGHAPQTP